MSDLEYSGQRHDGAREALEDLTPWLRHDTTCDAVGDVPDSLDCICGLRPVVVKIDDAWP